MRTTLLLAVLLSLPAHADQLAGNVARIVDGDTVVLEVSGSSAMHQDFT